VVRFRGTSVECASAAARLRREGVLDLAGEERVLALVDELRGSWVEILPSSEVRALAGRLLRVHSLTAADALQLGAALVWSGGERGLSMVTLDERLALAARLEGFEVG